MLILWVGYLLALGLFANTLGCDTVAFLIIFGMPLEISFNGVDLFDHHIDSAVSPLLSGLQ